MTAELDSADVARYLAETPGFFEEHAELLARIKLTSPLAGRTISLQERQMEILREKNKTLELHMANLIRVGQDNDIITDRMQEWSRSLLAARNDVDLPQALVAGLQKVFNVPHVTLRVWGVAEQNAHAWFAAPVSDDARIFSNGLTVPFCGPNHDFEAAGWLEDAPAIASLAMLAIRSPSRPEAFGLLVMGSPDGQRFTADMATDFLAKIGETASAALCCLLD
jgi:hypothetical protein